MRGTVRTTAIVAVAAMVPMMSAAGTAGAAATRSAWPAYAHAMRVEGARDAEMAARQQPRVALRAPAPSASPSIFDSAKHVEQIGRDDLKGGEQDTQTEPDMAMDPNNANGLVAVEQQGRFKTGGSVDAGFSTSLDGGKTWMHGNLPGLTTAVGGTFDRASDAAVAFGPNHVAYVTTLDFTFGHKVCPSAVSVQSSTDGGLTWSDPVFPENDRTCSVFNDKNWIGVDTNPSSPFYGRIYLMWTRFTATGGPAVLRYSGNGGRKWSHLIEISGPNEDIEGVLPLIASNGDVTVVYDDFIGGQDYEIAQSSTDGGLTWSAPVTIAVSLAAGDPGMRTGGLPAAAIDPTNDEMYVVWQDTRFRSDGHNDIVLADSTDGGATWSSPARVNPRDLSSEVLDHFTPDVAAYGGVVHVTYRTRDLAGQHPSEFVDERYIVSTDGGATFGGELVLGPPANLKYAAVVTGGRAFLGDYMAVVANGTVVHAAWCISRFVKNARYHQTLWGATIPR